MRRPLPLLFLISGCLLLGGFSAGVQPHIAAGTAPADLASTLATETHQRLAAEFAQQQVGFELAGTRVWPKPGGLLRVRAEGTADFGPEGRAATTIEAVYDPRSRRWVQLDYQLL